jgi:hypothetical protein
MVVKLSQKPMVSPMRSSGPAMLVPRRKRIRNAIAKAPACASAASLMWAL